MNFNPADLVGVLPALILAAGALVLLVSEVFLRTFSASASGPSPAKPAPPRPEVLGRAGGQPVSAAERAETHLPRGRALCFLRGVGA